jgi:TorA maturation chaperone TorD
VNETLAESYGMLALINIFSSVWLGDWDQYEKSIAGIPKELLKELPFHGHYQRDEVDLWYQNHFFIPGDYFVSPYFSTYASQENRDHEKTNAELLCLIGIYEKMGFYFPLEKKIYPDHIGCLNVFMEGIVREEITSQIKQDQALLNQLNSLREEITDQYLLPLIKGIKKDADKNIQLPFLREIVNFYTEFFKKDIAMVKH